jgi:predicted transcriptional regulator
MRHRSRTEIVARILEIVNEGDKFGNGGVSKTKIMYKVSLRYAQLQEYLTVLTESDLLSYDAQNRTFKAAEKGLIFLKAHAQINNQLAKEQKI